MNWIKGFLVGLVLIVVAFGALVTIADLVHATSDIEIGLYNSYVLLLGSWFAEVILLLPYGALPRNRTVNAFMARSVFVWMPVCGGWYLAYHWSITALWVGLIISSTCVGYNLVVTTVQKKT